MKEKKIFFIYLKKVYNKNSFKKKCKLINFEVRLSLGVFFHHFLQFFVVGTHHLVNFFLVFNENEGGHCRDIVLLKKVKCIRNTFSKE